MPVAGRLCFYLRYFNYSFLSKKKRYMYSSRSTDSRHIPGNYEQKICVFTLSISLFLRSIYIGRGRLTLGFRGPQLNQTLGSNYATLVHAMYIYANVFT
jgi:hypothetical protein